MSSEDERGNCIGMDIPLGDDFWGRDGFWKPGDRLRKVMLVKIGKSPFEPGLDK